MEIQELKELWKSYDKKLEASLRVNRKILEELQTQKAQSSIRSSIRTQGLGIFIGIFYVLGLGFLVYYNLANLYFSISIGMIMLFTILAIAAYLRHVVILGQINISESILETQKKLSMVQSSDTAIGRLMILQTPFWCTFFLSNTLLEHAGLSFWVIWGPITGALTFGSIWLYRNLTRKNMHKKWVRTLLDSFGGKYIRKASEFLNEIEEFNTEKT